MAAAIVMLAATAGAAWAQSEGTVRGLVRAAAGDVALAGAAVSLTPVPAGAPVRTRTDAAGRFAFQHVRPGEYVLSTSPDGFTNRQVRFVLEPREVRVVTLAVDVQGIGVSVEVTAPLAPIEGTHSPSSTVLGAERIESVPIAQRVNLSDVLLTAAPGMVRADNDFVHVRGHEIGLSVLINGVSFWENPLPAYSGGLSPEVVDVANVMTGGFSAEYGNRFGGVVDIVTKSGFTVKNRGSVTVAGGEAGRRSVAGEYGGHRERIGYFAFGSVFASDRFQNPPDRESIHNSGRSAHAFLQADLNLGGAGSLRAVAMGDGSGFDIPKTPSDDERRPLADAGQRTRQQTAIAGWTRAASDVAIGATFYQRWSRSHLLPAAGPLTAIAEANRTIATVGGKVDVTWFSGRHAVKAGVDAVRLRPEEHLSYDYSGYCELLERVGGPRLHFAGGPIDFSAAEVGGEVSAYVQDAIQFGGRVTADAGIRVDRYGLVSSVTHASPRLNLALRAGGGAVLHASYNHFFAPPAIEGVLSSSAGLTARIEEIGVALTALRPATEHQFEIGASAPVSMLHLALTGYYRVSENAVHTTVWPDSRVYGHASFDRVRAYGLEARAAAPGLARRGLTGYANYAFGRIYYHNPVTGGFVTEADHVIGTNRFLAPMDQTHTLTAGLTYHHERTGLWLGTAMDYGSGTPTVFQDEDNAGDDGGVEETASRVPGHFTINLSFGSDLLKGGHGRARLSVRFDVENVTNSVYLVAQEEAAFGPALFSSPRLVSATATVRF